ncbi:MAG: putative bifunctional diguanylate cyclase/phosphodiesterase [Pseudomonadota bacterium]
MKRSLHTRLFLLLLASALVPLLVVGVLLDGYLHKVHEDFGREQTRSALTELRTNLYSQESELAAVAERLVRNDSVIGSLNLLSRYQDPEEPRPLIFEPERKALARHLEEVVRTTAATTACIRHLDGRLVALAFPEAEGDGSEQVIASHADGERRMLSREDDGTWRPIADAKLPVAPGRRPASPLSETVYRVGDGRLTQSVLRSVDLSPATDSSERLGTLRLAADMDKATLARMAASPELEFALFDSSGRVVFGPADAPAPAGRAEAPSLFDEAVGEARMGEEYLVRSGTLMGLGGEPLYLSALYSRALLNQEVVAARWVIGGAVLAAILLVLPVSLGFFRGGFATPLRQVMDGVAAFKRGDYDHRIPELGAHETDQLGRAMNRMARDVSQREQDLRETESRLAYLAHHDPLTDLPNRLQLQERLREILTPADADAATTAAVLFLDLDRFKNINNSLGHPIGDELLKAVARRLQATLPEGATLARVGGDEFMIVLPDVADGRATEAVAHRLLARLGTEPFVVQGYDLGVDASIGISLYPADGIDAATLIRNADAAMFQAKAAGSNEVRFYTQELTEAVEHKRRLEMDLRQAVDQGQLYLVYQPQVDLVNGEPAGMEALVRWQHPELGLVSPGEFIPVAEETHLILQVGNWVLGEACRNFQAMREAGVAWGRLAVNISAIQVQHGDLTEEVQAALAESGLPPGCLELEVTEAVFAGDAALQTFYDLRDLGVHLAVDDFGTGFSSLAYLKYLPVQRLKIDQSFVRDMLEDTADRAIVRSVVTLGRSLSLSVIAEGVETGELETALVEEGCREGQGFYYARPMHRTELEQWIVARRQSGSSLGPDDRPGAGTTISD